MCEQNLLSKVTEKPDYLFIERIVSRMAFLMEQGGNYIVFLLVYVFACQILISAMPPWIGICER